ncbi:MAG TPA: phosphoglucosamine mutase [Candidatus Hydrogenedens sp.]|nr:phosphoglucosamine mutase [Candidatus Hydrogenedens sp.]HOK10331.1 phosphoglucosamine mutase [Candidatus Hydrogenedens sp.]HOL20317.1 phosphoglucosamine mutase [Candidatus Hydrogenedens sp.]HPP59842.1 phosphoglucosamine mutase [Candidatus Hydrogenedens sp.]
MNKRLFGTDGVRGVANIHPMTAEMALKIGRAAGTIFQREKRQHTILIGKDTRRSCYMLENALTAGLCSVGVRVLLTGPLPTPGVSYIMRSLRCDGAIMISASHNPYYDNGIKIFGPDGYKIPDEIEDEIERLIQTGEVDQLRPTGEHVGTAKRIDDAVGRYIEFVKATFPKGMRLDGLRIVVDCANGAMYRVGPDTLSELGATVIPIADEPNGVNINDCCGSVYPEEMRAQVIREKADVGIAFDGDGDRLVMADAQGRLLDGNAILAILGVDYLKRGILGNNTLVTTVMSNVGLELALRSFGGKVVRTGVGDRTVSDTLKKEGSNLGGEPSGHILLTDYNVTGDAMIAALQLLAIMIRLDQPLSELGKIYQPLPEQHGKVTYEGKAKLTEEELNNIANTAEKELNGDGKVVIRYSGTEPVVRIMVQHTELRKAEFYCKKLVEQISLLLKT